MRGYAIILVAILAALTISASANSRTVHQQQYRALAWQIISHTFPAGYPRNKAWSVASCETSGFTDFLNNSSGAADLFQEMPGNHRRVFSYDGHSMRLNYYALSRRDSGPPTWYAAKIAYLQSHGGWNWSEWVCT